MPDSFYEKRGVSASKPDVKKAIASLDPGLYPGAFCKIVPDCLSGSNNHCLLAHSDGAGTKSIVAYLQFRSTGDASVFKGIAQDSLVMNLDDLLCVGATGPFLFSNTIGRNARYVPGVVLENIVQGYEEFATSMRAAGVEIYSCGGETADVGDLVRTIIVDSSVTCRMTRDDVINCAAVAPGHVIVGLASSGKAVYERAYNSGIGTNGFTAVRHSLLGRTYRRDYSEASDPALADLAYSGSCSLDDVLPGTSTSIGEACLSPTRTFAPIILAILKKHRKQISAMFHNTGGGQTKCMNFGKDVRYVKDNLMAVPPIFEFIQHSGGISNREMLQIFNMGHRYEIICEADVAQSCIEISESFGVAAQVIGVVESHPGRSLVINLRGETHEYQGEG